MDSWTIVAKLKQAGFEIVRVRGSHHVLANRRSGRQTVIPHPRKEIGAGLLRAIERQAGVKLR